MKFVAILAFLLSLPLGASAMECDNFIGRDNPVTDSLKPLDAFTNRQLKYAMHEANRWSRSCDRKLLYRELEAKLAGLGMGRIEKWAEKSATIPKIQEKIDAAEYIYRGSSFWRLPLMDLSGIAHSIKLAGHIIGTDKLGHFMAEGLKYYELVTEDDGGSLQKAIRWGVDTEEGIYGLGVSGVKSYADLAANLDGYRFWASILDGETPYFACAGGQFFMVREFTWLDYVTDAWDEGINCSVYTKHMAGVFNSNLFKHELTCPVKGAEIACHELSKLPNAKAFVSPICREMSPTGDYQYDPESVVFKPGRRGD